MSVTTIPEAAPTAVRREVERVGWLPAVVSERDTYYLRWQLAEGRCEELAAERDRAVALAADLAGRLAAEEAAGPRVTLLKDRGCRLNAAAYALWGREVAAVEVVYDRARRAIGLRPCAPDLAHARKLRADKGAYALSLWAFGTATGLLGEATVALTPRLLGGVLVIDLP